MKLTITSERYHTQTCMNSCNDHEVIIGPQVFLSRLNNR